MGIFDMTDNFMKQIGSNEFEYQNVNQYINGVKEHSQPLVSFTKEKNDVIYREQL